MWPFKKNAKAPAVYDPRLTQRLGLLSKLLPEEFPYETASKLSPFVDHMMNNIAKALDIPKGDLTKDIPSGKKTQFGGSLARFHEHKKMLEEKLSQPVYLPSRFFEVKNPIDQKIEFLEGKYSVTPWRVRIQKSDDDYGRSSVFTVRVEHRSVPGKEYYVRLNNTYRWGVDCFDIDEKQLAMAVEGAKRELINSLGLNVHDTHDGDLAFANHFFKKHDIEPPRPSFKESALERLRREVRGWCSGNLRKVLA